MSLAGQILDPLIKMTMNNDLNEVRFKKILNWGLGYGMKQSMA